MFVDNLQVQEPVVIPTVNFHMDREVHRRLVLRPPLGLRKALAIFFNDMGGVNTGKNAGSRMMLATFPHHRLRIQIVHSRYIVDGINCSGVPNGVQQGSEAGSEDILGERGLAQS